MNLAVVEISVFRPATDFERSKHFYRALLRLAFAIVAASSSGHTLAADFYHMLTVRYPSGLVKTFVGGPYSPQAWCEKQAQTVWDNVITTCGSCRKELQQCGEWSSMPPYYVKTFRNEPIAVPYVTAIPKGRILFSGVGSDAALAECRHTASQFRANGFPNSACISQ